MKKWISVVCFLLVTLGITIYAYVKEHNRAYGAFEKLVNEITKGYQIKQIIMIVIIFIIGWLFLKLWTKGLGEILEFTLAFPTGIMIWCLSSHGVLMVGIPYNRITMFLTIGAIILVSFFVRRAYISQIHMTDIIYNSLYVIGFAGVSTSGVLFTMMSSDSYHFVMQFGEMIAKIGRYDAETFAELLLWTGLSPALMSSLAVFGGFETIYGIHHFLMISFIGTWAYSLYENILKISSKKKAIGFAILMSLIILVTQAVAYMLGWLISSAYYMIYIYFLVYLIEKKYVQKEQIRVGSLYILLILMLVLTRGEAALLSCLVILCISRLEITNKELIFFFALPNAAMQILYYLKLVVGLRIYDSDLLNPMTMIMISTALVITLVYCVAIRGKIFLWLQKYLYESMFCGLIIVVGIFTMCLPERMLGNYEVIVHNLGNELWSYLPWIIFIALIINIHIGFKLNFLHMVWLGSILFNLLIYGIRFIGVRKGIGDSCNRAFIGLVPIIFLAVVCSIREKLIERANENYGDV